MFRTKTRTPDDVEESGLRRCLRATDLTLLGIGIFVPTGIAAATQAARR